jgi:hypothetical protein
VTLKPGTRWSKLLIVFRAAADGDLLDVERGAGAGYGRDSSVGTSRATSGRSAARRVRARGSTRMSRWAGSSTGGSGESSAHEPGWRLGNFGGGGCRPRGAPRGAGAPRTTSRSRCASGAGSRGSCAQARGGFRRATELVLNLCRQRANLLVDLLLDVGANARDLGVVDARGALRSSCDSRFASSSSVRAARSHRRASRSARSDSRCCAMFCATPRARRRRSRRALAARGAAR